MRIIDRYLLGQFVQTFSICFCSLTGLYIVFDAFTNLDEFVRFADKNGSLLAIMGEYYLYRSVFFFDQTSAILALVSAMFTVTWIQRHNEMTALSSAGIPTTRIIAPVVVTAACISLIAAANRESLIPAIRKPLSRDSKDLVGSQAKALSPRRDHETKILLNGKASYSNLSRIDTPSFLLPPELGEFGRQLVAKDAFYQAPSAAHPGGYLMRGVQQPADVAQRPSVPAEHPVIITPRDAPGWLKPDECFVKSNVTFDQLTNGQRWQQFSSTRELIAGLGNPSLDFGADVRIAIHGRIVQPLLDVTLLFLGLPLILTRENRNMFVAIGMCIGLVSLFMLVLLGSHYLGAISLISPALAAWLPAMIFVPLAVAGADPLRQ